MWTEKLLRFDGITTHKERFAFTIVKNEKPDCYTLNVLKLKAFFTPAFPTKIHSSVSYSQVNSRRHYYHPICFSHSSSTTIHFYLNAQRYIEEKNICVSYLNIFKVIYIYIPIGDSRKYFKNQHISWLLSNFLNIQ